MKLIQGGFEEIISTGLSWVQRGLNNEIFFQNPRSFRAPFLKLLNKKSSASATVHRRVKKNQRTGTLVVRDRSSFVRDRFRRGSSGGLVSLRPQRDDVKSLLEEGVDNLCKATVRENPIVLSPSLLQTTKNRPPNAHQQRIRSRAGRPTSPPKPSPR